MSNLSNISTASENEISTGGAEQFSPARLPRAKSRGKRWENARENLRSAVGAALTRELFHFLLPTPRSRLASGESRGARLRIGVSLSSLNLSWSTN